MLVTLARKPEATKAELVEADATQVAVASGSLVVNLRDGDVTICPLDEIGNLIITDSQVLDVQTISEK